MLAYPWREIELTLTAERDYPNPYTNVEVWAEFTHDSGIALRRLAFWDGGRACAAGSDTAWALPWRATEQQFSGSPL